MGFNGFKNYITEKASYNRSIASLMSQSKIPITDKISKSLGYGKQTEVFHATTIKHLEGLSKLGKSKKQISTFTKGLGSLIGAISIKPDVIAKLEGTAVMEFQGDIFSDPDTQGRRWLNTKNHKKSKFLDDAVNGKVVKKMIELTDSEYTFEEVMWGFDNKKYIELFESLSGKEKQEIIKLYMDNITQLMSNKVYQDIFFEIQDEKSSSSPGGYDEVIMNKFKVIGVYSIEANKYKYDHSMAQYDIEKLGYKYLGHISKDDFRNFSNKTF